MSGALRYCLQDSVLYLPKPSGETMDEMLEDIDEVLEQLGPRVIVILDDLDRLEPKLINNVLFTVPI